MSLILTLLGDSLLMNMCVVCPLEVKYLIVYDGVWGVLVTAYKESAQRNE